MSYDTTYEENRYESLCEKASEFGINVNQYDTADELESAIFRKEADIDSRISEMREI